MSEIRVDTISEKTSANGVAVDGVTLKDGNVGATGTATSVAGIPFFSDTTNNSICNCCPDSDVPNHRCVGRSAPSVCGF